MSKRNPFSEVLCSINNIECIGCESGVDCDSVHICNKIEQINTLVYNEISSHFDKTRYYKWEWVTNFILETKKNATILDMGCGNGRNMEYPRDIIGIDNSQNL